MTYRTLGKRAAIIFVWLVIIFSALYLPHMEFTKQERVINVFTWGDILDSRVVAAFEHQTGIKVRLSYYASNEELVVKLKATGGEGYDLIMPSDYAVYLLAKDQLLSPIDHTKLDFWHDVHPKLLNHSFDPDNRYSVPLEWEVFGLGINSTMYKEPSSSIHWKTIFDPGPIDFKIMMVNDPMQALLLGDLYLYNKVEPLSKEQFTAITDLLMRQKEWVEAYADFRADYFLATESCPIAVASTSYIWRAKRLFPFIDFVVPSEGSFITIENVCIPAKSTHQEWTYAFINFLFRPEVGAIHFENLGFFPSTYSGQQALDEDAKELLRMFEEHTDSFHFFQKIYSPKEVRDMWVEVKS